ncbi:MAG: sugar ABC transporter permease [Bacillota bacterium]|nr:MAG: sugar ABC transporter permease [Bacillota bacterium]
MQEALAAYLFLLPFGLSLLIFFGYAFVRSIYFSFTDYNMFDPPNWVGLANYAAIFRETRFLTALRNSIGFSLIVTVSQTAFALLLAVVLNARIRGIAFFRTAYYMPSVASSVVVTLIFLWAFQRTGLFNYLLGLFRTYWPMLLAFLVLAALFQVLQVLWDRRRGHPARWLEPGAVLTSLLLAAAGVAALWATGRLTPVETEPVRIVWLNTRRTIPEGGGWFSLPLPLISIMMLNTWTTAPTFMLLYLAGLQDIPKELYEAAAVDGANRWQQFRYVTLPQLKHITFLVMALGLIGTLQMFDQVAVIGSAAPLDSVITLAYYVYSNVFPGGALPRVGMASAAAVILAILTLIAVLIQRRVVEGND